MRVSTRTGQSRPRASCPAVQVLAIGFMTRETGGVGPPAVLHLMIGIALVHGMAAEAAQLAATVLVARRQRHALVFQRRRQRRAVAPEAAVERLRTLRPQGHA